jgi:chromatin modification-related protein EAF6
MTESAPPPSVPNMTATSAVPTTVTNQPGASNNSNSNGTASAQSGANRGLPYYEKLRRELRDTLQKKRLMDKSMVCHLLEHSPCYMVESRRFIGSFVRLRSY